MTADENLLPLVETRVERGRVDAAQIPPPRQGASRCADRATVWIRVELIQLAGMACRRLQPEGERLRAGKLSLSVGGSGGISAALRAERRRDVGPRPGQRRRQERSATLSIAGSGSVAIAGLAADDVSVGIAGSGSAEVQAQRRLTISIAGSGRVRHSGPAVPTVSIVGSGGVQRG